MCSFANVILLFVLRFAFILPDIPQNSCAKSIFCLGLVCLFPNMHILTKQLTSIPPWNVLSSKTSHNLDKPKGQKRTKGFLRRLLDLFYSGALPNPSEKACVLAAIGHFDNEINEDYQTSHQW